MEGFSSPFCYGVKGTKASFPELNGNPTLERIGKKISRKCDGLPLATETLGCLCRRHDVEEWEKIFRSDIWGFSINDSKIIPALLAPHAALQSITISGCMELVSFTGEGLAAPNLTHLYLAYCYKLEVPEGGLPPNLKHLGIHEPFWGRSLMLNLEALTHLTINGSYTSIKSYPYSLPNLPSLTTLKLTWFYDMETLDCNQLLHLTSLQHLHIEWCQKKLENMVGEKLPSSLL
ncbi:hypothetical protein PIB30_054607 [Stylosanthes scabra]|uniref:Uncharacterized protein n=1 Tax=Stylosanthes scabra TaxID=79078 RepID=A0ABU6RJB5_9FABA|nr:hypothetical protein [Stylosanthes scabra]